MALSGTISSSIHSGHYTLKISWSATQNITNNTSTITAKMYLVQDASWSLSIGTRDNTCSIDGVSTAFTSPKISSNGGSTILLGTVSRTVNHNTDGSRNVVISATFNINATISGTKYNSITASATVTLDTIPRVSSFTLSASTVELGKSVTITITRQSTAFTHRIKYSFAGSTGTIATGVATSQAWTVPLSLANYIPSATEGTCTITVETMNGDTVIGSQSKTFTGTVPASVVPSISSVALSDPSGTVPSGWGVYIKGKSTLRVVTTAAGSYKSTIASYSIEANGATYSGSDITTGALQSVGTQSVKVTVTDTRGRTATSTKTYTVQDYNTPTISTFDGKRVNASGQDDDAGENVLISYSTLVSDVNGKNTASITIKYKPTGGSWVTAYSNASASYAIYDSITIKNISTDNTYEVRIDLTDSFTSSIRTLSIATVMVTMDFKSNGKGVAIGKVSEYDAFECAMNARFTSGFFIAGGINADHTAGVTAITSSDGAGKYVKLFSFPIDTFSGWNYSSLSLSFEECIFGLFSGILDLHIRNSKSTGTISQKTFACHSCRGNPYHYNFYLVIDNNVASVYWHCRSNYYGIRVRVLNGYMPHAGFSGITWDGKTMTSTAPGGELCSFFGAAEASGVWRYRKNADVTMEAWGQYKVSNIACDVALGSMYRSAVITLPDYPVAFTSVPTVQMSWTNAGYGAMIWITTEGTMTAPPTVYLVRPVSGTVTGTINIYAHGLK
jgi:hypothetical protein